MLSEELARIKARVQSRAKEVFDQRRVSVAGMGAFAQRFIDDLGASVGGGKAVRAALVYYGAIACCDEENESLADFALAMELFHTYLLIHDDVIDQDDKRRGKPSFHALYRDRFDADGHHVHPRHFGESMAMLGGDILSSIAYDVICAAPAAAVTRLQVLHQVNRMLFETGFGEILDVLNDLGSEASRAHLLKVHALKTSRYSFASPLLIGAAACAAGERQRALLEQFALPIGIAYQLHDDVLGMFGDEEKIGKPVQSDLRQGKQTLLMIEAYARCSPSQRQVLDAALGNPLVTVEQARAVQDVVRDTGAYDYSIALARRFQEMAVCYLDEAHLSVRGRTFLQELALYITAREY